VSKAKPLIAVVDDDEPVCRAIGRLVRSLGMEADTFTSGQEFIEILEGMPWLRVDCVVLDIQMPDVNGLEIQRRLMKLSGKALPVIFITAHDAGGVREQAMSSGAVAFLRKPFNDELLIRTLTEALKRRTGGKQK
jgi:FixJ family two-component response regulator